MRHSGPRVCMDTENIYLIGFDFREYGKGELNNIYQDTDYYGERNDDKIFDGWLNSSATC